MTAAAELWRQLGKRQTQAEQRQSFKTKTKTKKKTKTHYLQISGQVN